MEDSINMAKTLSWDQKDKIILLKRLMDEGITPDMAKQISILEKTFTRKMETLLTQRILAVVNS